MNGYRKKLQRRMALDIGAVILGIAVVLILSNVTLSMEKPESTFYDGFVKGAGIGMFVGFTALFAVAAVKCAMDMRSEERMRAREIAENDERCKMIREKAGGTGYNFAMGGLALGAVAATYINNTVAITLMGALLFVAMIKGGLKLYYMKKY